LFLNHCFKTAARGFGINAKYQARISNIAKIILWFTFFPFGGNSILQRIDRFRKGADKITQRLVWFNGLPAGINQRYGSPSHSGSLQVRLPSSIDGSWKIRANIPASAAVAV
jgi:hypothetical protein